MKLRQLLLWIYSAACDGRCAVPGKLMGTSGILSCDRFRGHPGHHQTTFSFQPPTHTMDELQHEMKASWSGAIDGVTARSPLLDLFRQEMEKIANNAAFEEVRWRRASNALIAKMEEVASRAALLPSYIAPPEGPSPASFRVRTWSIEACGYRLQWHRFPEGRWWLRAVGTVQFHVTGRGKV